MSGSPSAAAAGRARPPDGMRDVPCLFCGVADERLRFVEAPFRVVECARCGLVYVNPRLPPERLHAMYQHDYWTSDRASEFGYSAYLAEAPLYLRTYRLRSRHVRRHCPAPGRVLDVGCAAGFFLAVMKEQGWRTTGVELSEPMVEHARSRLDLPDVRVGDLLGVDLPPASFDLITMWDVIEHLEDPPAHLSAARRLLAPGGRLLLETQNVDSAFARLLGRRWQHYKHEEHLYHFDPRSLRRLLETTGWEPIDRTARYSGKYVSIDFMVERLRRLHPVLSTLASPLRAVGGLSLYVNLRDEMIVVARGR